MANEDIKNLIKKKRLFQYEVADAMGISEGYLTTILRKPLSDERRKKVLTAITKLTEEETRNDYE
ncbi:MAG: hypothetical protein PUH86_01985 [Lachnospiraceae bacterium]|nr:hypothetical protein [Lachnospiraceae bacterium]MDY5806435.1 hypothetical protein [Lachnospira sp.]